MKQLKMDNFVVRGGGVRHGTRTPWQCEPEVICLRCKAFCEYEDVAQNVYLYRARRNPLVDGGVAYCRCYQYPDWSLTCLTCCENRATQTECVLGHCATNYKCSNQRMQRGEHAALELRSVLGKGNALIAEKTIEEDELVAQYVGEVLSLEMYLDRERKQTNSRHTYGMAITASEVIDARYVGGMARFANHSCCPNCLVERWEVAGETCCALFAKEKISVGEEITIDYGHEFVRSKDKVKCLCEAPCCKGFM